MRCLSGSSGSQCTLCDIRHSQSLSYGWTQRTTGHGHHNLCMVQMPFQAGESLHTGLSFGVERRLHRCTECRGIGFDLGLIEPNRGAEENAKKLYTAAYSLLLMHDVLQSKAGGAFLKVLLHLQKGSPEHLLSAYGEWFREIASSGHTSWQDYLLDEIISGKGNPLARAAARGEAGQEQAMQQAVAYDLDTLQRLAITETTLSGWVSHVASPPEGWLLAAAPSNGIRQSSEYSSLGPESTSKEMPLVSDKDSLAWISAPLLPRQRRDWRDKIGGCWKWSEALPDLLALWQAHGTGLVAKHALLHFQDGALTAPSPASDIATVRTPDPFGKLGELPQHPQALVDILERIRDGDGAVLQEGIAHLSQRCTAELWPPLAQVADTRGPRIVMVQESSLSEAGLDALARALSQHPRMLFFAMHLSRDPDPQSTHFKPLHLLCGEPGLLNWPKNAALFKLTDIR